MKEREIAMVVLDWAGTTVDFGSCAPAGAFVRAYAEMGVTVSERDARGPMGLHKKDHIRELFKVQRIAADWQAKHRRVWSEADVNALYALVTPMQVKAAGEQADLVPGLLETVKELRSMGIRIAASTGYFREAAEVVYAKAAAQGYVPDFKICADEVPAGRPAPWMIFRCMEALNVYPPNRVVKLGDTLVDIADGRNAGVWSMAVVDSSSELGLSKAEFDSLTDAEKAHRRGVVRKTFENADAVIDTIAALPEAIREVNRRLTDSL